MPGFHGGRRPRNKVVMRTAGDCPDVGRLRGRSRFCGVQGYASKSALALTEADWIVAAARGGRRRAVGMDAVGQSRTDALTGVIGAWRAWSLSTVR
jgi:hypothetical protein